MSLKIVMYILLLVLYVYVIYIVNIDRDLVTSINEMVSVFETE